MSDFITEPKLDGWRGGPSIARIEQLARESQAAADARRIAEVNARDDHELAWAIGLGILCGLVLVTVLLVGFGVIRAL